MEQCYWKTCERKTSYKLKGGFDIAYCPYHAVYISILLGDYKKAFKIYDKEKIKEKGEIENVSNNV